MVAKHVGWVVAVLQGLKALEVGAECFFDTGVRFIVAKVVAVRFAPPGSDREKAWRSAVSSDPEGL
jgi:hypothetical protein